LAQKTLSIIIPCWRLSRKPFWGHVLKSILETKATEVILIDNSPGDSVNRKLRLIPNVRVLNPGKNLGAAASWNLGFKESSGDIVLFSADDILLRPEPMRKAVALVSEEIPFVYGDYGIVQYEDNTFQQIGENKSRPFDKQQLLEGIYLGYVSNYIDGASPMRRDVFPGFDVNLPRYIDWDMIARIVKAGYTGHYLSEKIFYTIEHPERSITRDDNPPLEALKRIRAKWKVHSTLSGKQKREIEFIGTLLELYQERAYLERAFPIVKEALRQLLVRLSRRARPMRQP